MNTSDVKKVRDIIEDSQHLHKHQKCLKNLQQFYDNNSQSEEFIKEFTTEFGRDIWITLNSEPKSPNTKHIIEFIAKYLETFSSPKRVVKQTNNDSEGDTTIIDEEMAAQIEAEHHSDRSDQENRPPIDDSQDQDFDELGMDSFGSQSFNTSKHKSDTTVATEEETEEETFTFLDIIVKEKLIPFSTNAKTHIRYNCCFLVRKLFTNLEDINFDVYKKLKKALLERLRDKDKSVRSAAALALHRFQEVDEEKDLVSDALKFHLNYDPDFRVRHSCLLSLHPTLKNISDFIGCTRDVKDIIRRMAYIIIADKFDVKNLGIGKRLLILKNGLNERHNSVKKIIESRLIPKWIKSYEEDICQFLYGLDIPSDPELIERMLFLYFNHINEDMDESTQTTGFHQFLTEFHNKFLEDYNLLVKEDLTVENAFLWRIVAKFCKEKDVTTESPGVVDEEITDSDSQTNQQKTVETIDAIDTIVPDLPHYCRFIIVFVRRLMESQTDLHQMMEFEFMFNQLLSIGELLEIGDEAQRQILHKCIIDLLENKELFERAHNFVTHLMKIFANNCELNLLLDTTIDIIDKINSESIDKELPNSEPFVNSQPIIATTKESIEEQLRQFELEYAKLSVRVESLKDDYESAKNDGNETEAQKIDDLIDSLTKRMDEVMDKRLRITLPQEIPSSQPSQNDPKTRDTLTEDPIALERCLQILCGCLEFGNLKTINPIIFTLIERLVLPSIPNGENRIRNFAVKALGLVCLIASDLAKKYFLLFVQVLNFDSEEAQETALQCIFDILCIHGLILFEEQPKSKRKSTKSSTNISISSAQKSNTNKSFGENTLIEEDNDNTIIDNEENDVLCSDSDEEVSEEGEENFMSLFTDTLEKNLFSESDRIKFITAQGIAKLFILGRMYSPQLLTKLLILWYDSESTEEMRQFLGAFFPIYSNVQMKPNLKGENAFEECFIKTVETVFEEGLNFVDLDNLINFVLELIADNGHKNLAKSVANQILTRIVNKGVDDTLSNRYYLRVLTILRLTEMSSHDIKEYKLLIDKIQRKLNRLKVKTKLTSNRLQTIKTKIDKQMDLIRENASQMSTIEEFGSLSLSQSLSQSLSERSHIDETIIDNELTMS